MSHRRSALSGLTARRLESLLEELAELERRARNGEALTVPRVTLHLCSGRAHSGSVLDVQGSGEGMAVLLDRDQKLVWLEARHIEAISLHDAVVVAPLLIVPDPDAPVGAPPTREVLERLCAELTAALTRAFGAPIAMEVAWDSIPDDDGSRHALFRALEESAATLRTIAAYDPGRLELAHGCAAVCLEHGPAPSARLDGKTLRISAALDRGRDGRFGAVELSTELAVLF